jgi:hypothetical protein
MRSRHDGGDLGCRMDGGGDELIPSLVPTPAETRVVAIPTRPADVGHRVLALPLGRATTRG